MFLLRDIPHAGSASWEKRKALELTLRKQGLLKRSSLNGQNIATKFRLDIFDLIECFFVSICE